MTDRELKKAENILKEHRINGSPMSFSEDAKSYRISYMVYSGETYIKTFPKTEPLSMKEYRDPNIVGYVMQKEDIVKKICDCFDYNYKFFEDGRFVMDDGLGVDHKSTTEWLGSNYCGHLEYQSIDDMLLDWLDELKTVPNAFIDEVKFINQLRRDFNIRLEETNMHKWGEIRDNYCDEDGKIHIDAWKTSNGNEEGEVIAKVNYKTKEIEYLNEASKTDKYVQEVIKEVLDNIERGNYEVASF